MNKNRLCRGCASAEFTVLLDLGLSPISNSLLSGNADIPSESRHPLCVVVCSKCGFCQLSEDSDPEVHFHQDYVYFSSFSHSWLNHCRIYAETMVRELKLNKNDLVVELASNDGYLLKNFQTSGIPVLGVEPSANVAKSAEESNIPTLVEFFGLEVSEKIKRIHQKPRLIIGNNVLAHVPDVCDFIHGIANLLAEDGVATLEFPHLTQLIINHQFDTIYHEHYSYLSVTALLPIFNRFNLTVFRVEELPTHGGSIRVHIAQTSSSPEVSPTVAEILAFESKFEPRNEVVRERFKSGVAKIIDNFRNEIAKQNSMGSIVVAFGAAAKGNTLLNAAGITSEQIKYIVDTNPAKQGKLAPGTHIPIVSLELFKSSEFEVCVILPWNLSSEISIIVRDLHGENAKILRAVPFLEYI